MINYYQKFKNRMHLSKKLDSKVDQCRIFKKRKNLTFFNTIAIVFFGIGLANAQVTVGTGTASSSNIPITSNYGYNYSQQIFTKAQINAAGNITSITYTATTLLTAGDFDTSKDWVVYMGHTSKTQFTSATDWIPTSALTQVFSGVVSYPATVPGNVTITFTTPFPYNNVDNLVVAVDENTASYGTLASWKSTTYTGLNRGIYYRNDTTNPNPTSPPTGTLTTTIPNLVLGGITPSCFTASAVTGVVSSATSANLSWTAPTNAPASGYQWEVRSSGAAGSGATGLASSGATVAGTVTAVTSTLVANTTYTLHVRSNCGGSDFSSWVASSTFTTPLSCFAPSTVSGIASSPTTANLSWVAPTTAPSTGYQWEVRTAGTGGSGATGLVDSGSTVAGVLTASTTLLTANTSYKLYVRSNCGAGDFSTWGASSSFVTPCLATAVPVSNVGFDVAGLPACWSASAITSTWAGIVGNSGDIAASNSGAGFMEKNYSSSTALLVSMPIDFTSVTAQARINMFMHRHASAHANDQYVVYVNNVPTLTGATQLLSLYSKTTIAPTVAGTGWYRNLINIPTSFNGSANVYILVEGKTSGGFSSYDLGIDDFKVEYATLESPDFASIESPATHSMVVGNSLAVSGRVGKLGLTDVEPGLSGKADGIEAWIGISPVGVNSNPNTWTNWIVASHVSTYVGANDEYKATIGASLPPGTYYYASRFSLNGGTYQYGGISASNVGGVWDGTTNNSGVLTINPIPGDYCSIATSIVVGTTYDVNNSLATNSTEVPVPTCGSFSTEGKDLWFSVQVPANVNRLTVQTLSASTLSLEDSVVQGYRGTCGSLSTIGCNDDDTSGSLTGFSLLNLTGLISGETILLRVWGYDSEAGAFKLKVSVPSCASESVWNGTAWSNGIPTTGVVATISGNYTGPGFTACSLEITGTSQIVFMSGSNLILNGLLNVASTASVTLESNANLVQTVNGTNTGSITVKRESAQLVRLDHTLWSSPVAAQKLFAFSPNTLTNRFYTYDTPTNTFVNTGLTATTDFATAKGYGIRAANNHPETPTTWMGSFTGNPNNGNKSFTLALTGTGFNLIGNPYPSVMDAAAFVTANSARINGTLYFYAHTLTMSTTGTFPAGTNYALWNATGQTAATLGTSGVPALIPNGKIQVGQGFLVKATAAGNASFTNAMREASNGNQFFRVASEVQSTSDIEKHRLWLNLTNPEGTAFNQILVGYISGATQDVDNLYDGLSFGNEGSSLSSRLADQDFTIQGRALPFNQADVVPLGLKAITPGNYTISLSDKDGIFAGNQNVYLKDNENGSVNNIKTAPYTFIAQAGTFNNRFEVIYQANLSTPESAFTSNSVIAYIKNAQLNIQAKGNNMKAISVFDVRGRLIFQQSGINTADFTAQGLSAQNQVLLVQVTSENDEVVTIKVMF